MKPRPAGSSVTSPRWPRHPVPPLSQVAAASRGPAPAGSLRHPAAVVARVTRHARSLRFARPLCLAAALAIPALDPLTATPDGGPAPPPPTRPNIIVLVADDLRWDAMSCAGNPVLQTPNLDRIARAGTRFTNAFVTTPICCVSRASILTGQYARRHGVHDFKTPVTKLDSLYPVILRRHGYQTGFIGKWGIAAASGKYFQECAAAFDFWAGDLGQTSYWHSKNCNYLTNNGTDQRANFFCDCPQPARAAEGCGPAGPHPALQDPVHAETEFIPAKVRSFLAQTDSSRPFCLSVSFKAPHGPWRGYAPAYDKEFVDTAIPRRDNGTPAEALRQPNFLRQSLGAPHGLRLTQNPRERDELFHQYYRLIRGLDFAVGKILDELQTRNLAANTVVLFTADNGHFAGEHGFFGKWFPHEESIRVPLLLSDPRLPAGSRGSTSDAMVLNIDVAPTVLALAGVPAPATMQGQCLLPLTEGKVSPPWRDAFFIEHLYTHAATPPKHIEPNEGVRTRDAKYMLWLDQSDPAREELYQLEKDPLEMRNLAQDPSAADDLARMRALHATLRMQAQ